MDQSKRRELNHQIFLLDKFISADKVSKDDTSIISIIDDFTLAQLVRLMRVAKRKKAQNCLSLLQAQLEKKHPGVKIDDVQSLFSYE